MISPSVWVGLTDNEFSLIMRNGRYFDRRHGWRNGVYWRWQWLSLHREVGKASLETIRNSGDNEKEKKDMALFHFG
jgi:hypothetical protein